MSSAAAAASSSNASDVTGVGNGINPLLKIVFVHRVLRFVDPKVMFVHSAFGGGEQRLSNRMPKFLELRLVNSSFCETIDYYTSLDSDVVHDFCIYIKDFVGKKHSESPQHATLARDAFLWISKFVKDSKAIERWCQCVAWVVRDNYEANLKIFATEGVRDAFVAISEFATANQGAIQWCDACFFVDKRLPIQTNLRNA